MSMDYAQVDHCLRWRCCDRFGHQFEGKRCVRCSTLRILYEKPGYEITAVLDAVYHEKLPQWFGQEVPFRKWMQNDEQ